MKLLRRRAAGLRAVEFCESSSEVCTPACRSKERVERTRRWAAYHSMTFLA